MTESMFLPGVEQGADPTSRYARLIGAAQAAGREYPQIRHLFAYKPQATEHLARFTQHILREPAPLTPGFRDLIAARTASATTARSERSPRRGRGGPAGRRRVGPNDAFRQGGI